MAEVIRVAEMKVKVIGSGKTNDPFRVNLPTWTMIPGTEEYADPEKKVLKAVRVIVPDDEVTAAGKLDQAKIRKKYKGQVLWDNPNVAVDVEAT